MTITLTVTEASLQGKTVTDKLKNVSAQVNSIMTESVIFFLFITRLSNFKCKAVILMFGLLTRNDIDM